MEIKVMYDGKILDSSKYIWNPISKYFSTNESGIEIDFGYMNNVVIHCEDQSTIHAYGKNVVVNCGKYCMIHLNCNEPINANTGNFCIISTKKRFHFIRKFIYSLFNR